MEKREPSYTVTLLVECKLVQPLWRAVWRFLKELEIELQQSHCWAYIPRKSELKETHVP